MEIINKQYRFFRLKDMAKQGGALTQRLGRSYGDLDVQFRIRKRPHRNTGKGKMLRTLLTFIQLAIVC